MIVFKVEYHGPLATRTFDCEFYGVQVAARQMGKRAVCLSISDFHQLEFLAATWQAHPRDLRRDGCIGDTDAGHSIEQRSNHVILVGLTWNGAMHRSLI